MNVTTFGKLSNNLVVVVVIIVTMLEIRGFAPRSFLALTMPFYTLRPLQTQIQTTYPYRCGRLYRETAYYPRQCP